jgi:hypothetical protein
VQERSSKRSTTCFENLNVTAQVSEGKAIEESVTRQAHVRQEHPVRCGNCCEHPIDVLGDEQSGYGDVPAEESILYFDNSDIVSSQLRDE